MIVEYLDRLFHGYALHFLRRRVMWVVLVLGLVAVLLSGLRKLRFDNSPESMFLKSDPVLEQYDRFKTNFGSDEVAFVVLRHEAAWTPEFIGQLRTLTDTIRDIPGVIDATSIVNARRVVGEEGSVRIDDFIPSESPSADELRGLRELARNHPYYRGLYINRAGDGLAILARTEIRPGDNAFKRELTGSLRELLTREPYKSWNARVIGQAVLDSDVRQLVMSESGLYATLSTITTALVLAIVFRSFIAVVLPIGTGLLSIACALGIMGHLHAPFGLLSPILPSFLLSVGIGPSVVILWDYFQHTPKARDNEAAIVAALEHSASSSFLSVVTTAAGLLAFASSKIGPVQDLGYSLGLALLVAFTFSVTLVPFFLSLRRRRELSEKQRAMLLGRVAFFKRNAEWVLRRRRPITVVFCALMVVSIVGALRLETDYYYLGLFKSHTRIRQDYAFADGVLKNSASLEVVVDSGKADGLKQPGVLAAVLAFERDVERRLPEFGGKTYSLADFVAEVNQALHGGDPAHYRVPDEERALSDVLLLCQFSGNDELKKLATPDLRQARIRVGLVTQSDRKNRQAMALIAQESERHFGKLNANVAVTGLVPMWIAISGYLASSEAEALSITAAVVALVLGVAFRSMALGVLMAALNAAVVCVTLGVMGWFKIALDPYTMLVASIALGILDDDSVHLVRDVQRRYEASRDLEQSVVAALSDSAPGLLFFSVSLICGCLVYFLSDVASLTKFGGLVAFTLALGALIEFVASPAILLMIGPRLFQRRGETLLPATGSTLGSRG